MNRILVHSVQDWDHGRRDELPKSFISYGFQLYGTKKFVATTNTTTTRTARSHLPTVHQGRRAGPGSAALLLSGGVGEDAEREGRRESGAVTRFSRFIAPAVFSFPRCFYACRSRRGVAGEAAASAEEVRART